MKTRCPGPLDDGAILPGYRASWCPAHSYYVPCRRPRYIPPPRKARPRIHITLVVTPGGLWTKVVADMGVEPNILRLWASDDSGLYCFISPIRFTHPQWEQRDSNPRPLSCKGSAAKPTELYSQFSPKVNTILSVILTHWMCTFFRAVLTPFMTPQCYSTSPYIWIIDDHPTPTHQDI